MIPPAERTFTSDYHSPVLVHEVVEQLQKCKTVIDCTLGGGGHSHALLEAGVERIYGIDRDPEAISVASRRLEPFGDRFIPIQGEFSRMNEMPEFEGVNPDGILADLGVSSHQLDDISRGFSFRPAAPLDMRMEANAEQSSLPTAADILNSTSEAELANIFFNYGDEPKSRRLASEVVRRREKEPFSVSDHLVNAIRAALGPRSGPGDFARLFQALRIAVNDEMDGLERALIEMRDKVVAGGKVAIISYHSGEDRRVKHAMREWSIDCVCPPRQPFCNCAGKALGRLINRKAIVASNAEAERNPRARSARLRVWQKTA